MTISSVSNFRQALINSESRLSLIGKDGNPVRQYKVIDKSAQCFYNLARDSRFILIDRTQSYLLLAPIIHNENIGSYGDSSEAITVYSNEVEEATTAVPDA